MRASLNFYKSYATFHPVYIGAWHPDSAFTWPVGT